MRDGNRLREKIELRLDRRQVTSVAVVALLSSATIFVLGVMVGKNLVPLSRSAPAPTGLLDRLDAQAEHRDDLDPDGGSPGGEPFNFQDELTKKVPKPPRLEPLRAIPPPAPPQPRHDAVQLAAQLSAPDAGRATPAATALPPIADADSEVAVAVAAKVVPAARPFFTVQVKATQSQAEADRFAKLLRGKGYQVLIAEAEVAGKGHWYRVRVGHFDTRARADHYLEDFKRESHLQAFVTAAGH